MSPREEILKISLNPKNFNIPKCDNLAVIFANSYYGTSMELGDCVINDGLVCNDKFKELGYECLVFYDILTSEFIKVLNDVCKEKFKKLIIYFSGHGSQTRDKNHDEYDNYDEVFIFKNGHVVDDDVKKIIDKSDSEKITLISDSCHSGTIFDTYEDKKKILTIGACLDKQQAAQYYFERKGNGCFTHYFWKYYDTYKNNREELAKMINKKLEQFNHKCSFSRYDLDIF